MRITCPKCDAEYNVPVKAIPQAGREVQCSACRHRWHQLPLTGSGRLETLTLSGQSEDHEDEETTRQPRRKIDPEVLEVLRQEATREAAAREAEGTFATSAPAPPPRNRPRNTESIRARLARLQEAERAARPHAPASPKPTTAATKPAPARKRTSASDDEPGKATAAEPSKPVARPAQEDRVTRTAKVSAPSAKPESAPPATLRQRSPGLPVALSSRELALIEERKTREGFRWGFAATLGACCAVLLLYLSAPYLSRSFPAAAGTFNVVSERGEAVQTQIAQRLRGALEALTTPAK